MPPSKFLRLKNITSQEFSRTCGVNDTTFYQILKGYMPTPRLAEKLIKHSEGLITLRDLYAPLFKLQESMRERGRSAIEELKDEYFTGIEGNALD